MTANEKTLLAVVASVMMAGAAVSVSETPAFAKSGVTFKVVVGKKHMHRHCHWAWHYRHHHWVKIKVCSWKHW